MATPVDIDRIDWDHSVKYTSAILMDLVTGAHEAFRRVYKYNKNTLRTLVFRLKYDDIKKEVLTAVYQQFQKDYNQRFGENAFDSITSLEFVAAQQLIKDNPQILAALGMDIVSRF